MWLKVDGFVDRVRHWWLSYRFQGSPNFIFAQKLKVDLKRGNEQEFGNVEAIKQAQMEELSALDILEEELGFCLEEKVWKCLVIRGLETILQEEINWRQKFRILWLKEGDKCIEYFHWVANSKLEYEVQCHRVSLCQRLCFFRSTNY
jgi:hypothetical protein